MTYFKRFPAERKTIFATICIMSLDQVERSLEIAANAKVDGVFLTTNQRSPLRGLEALASALNRIGWFERIWLGVSCTGIPYSDAYLAACKLPFEGLWGQQLGIEELEAQFVDSASQGDSSLISFDGLTQIDQLHDDDPRIREAVAITAPFCEVLTTTTHPDASVPIHRLQIIKEALGDRPLLLNDCFWPNGNRGETLSPKLVGGLLPYIDGVIADWSIRRRENPYHLDDCELKRLVKVVHAYQPPN